MTKEKDEYKKISKEFKLPTNKWKTFTIVLIVVLAISIFTGGFGIKEGGVSEAEATEQVSNYVESLLNVKPEISDFKRAPRFYQFKITLMGQEYTSCLSTDGKMLLTNCEGTDISDIPEAPTTPETVVQEVPKTEKPNVELFVMSFCPYGNKAEDTMISVYELLKEKVDWSIRYIVDVNGDNVKSLHGQPETDQNIREVCVLNEYGLSEFWKFTTYVNKNCGSDGSCWEKSAEETGISASKIQTCFEEQGLELMKKEAEATKKAGASGSPTLLINGVKSRAVYQYGNSEAYKQEICSAFTTTPEECEEVLSATQTAQEGSC